MTREEITTRVHDISEQLLALGDNCTSQHFEANEQESGPYPNDWSDLSMAFRASFASGSNPRASAMRVEEPSTKSSNIVRMSTAPAAYMLLGVIPVTLSLELCAPQPYNVHDSKNTIGRMGCGRQKEEPPCARTASTRANSK